MGVDKSGLDFPGLGWAQYGTSRRTHLEKTFIFLRSRSKQEGLRTGVLPNDVVQTPFKVEPWCGPLANGEAKGSRRMKFFYANCYWVGTRHVTLLNLAGHCYSVGIVSLHFFS